MNRARKAVIRVLHALLARLLGTLSPNYRGSSAPAFAASLSEREMLRNGSSGTGLRARWLFHNRSYGIGASLLRKRTSGPEVPGRF